MLYHTSKSTLRCCQSVCKPLTVSFPKPLFGDLGDCVQVITCSVFSNLPDKKSLCQAFFAVTTKNAGYGVPDGRKASLYAPRRPPHRYGSGSRSGAAACRACCAKPPCFADERQTWRMLVSAMRSYENISTVSNRSICSRQGGLNASRPPAHRAASGCTCSPITLKVHCATVLADWRQAFQSLLTKCVPKREFSKALRPLRSARCDRFN